eukprot:jgi/Hompol1/1739/HPOL_001541-RA
MDSTWVSIDSSLMVFEVIRKIMEQNPHFIEIPIEIGQHILSNAKLMDQAADHGLVDPHSANGLIQIAVQGLKQLAQVSVLSRRHLEIVEGIVLDRHSKMQLE